MSEEKERAIAPLTDRDELFARLRDFTPARIGISTPGEAQPTRAALRFALDHARARDAVLAPLDCAGLADELASGGFATMRLHSAATDRADYLRRPDLGRRLGPKSQRELAASGVGCRLAVVAADGLSSLGVRRNVPPLLGALAPALAARGLVGGPIFVVEEGRVAIGDEIGEIVGARLVLMLIGERPGLTAADSLGAYLTFAPRVGTMDSARNCISNIRAGGLAPALAAAQIDALIALALDHGMTGVALAEAAAGAPAIAG